MGYTPDVFAIQRATPEHSSRYESDVLFTGIRIHIQFDPFTPPGKRNLSTPLHDGASSSRQSDVPFDLLHKNFAWDTATYYKSKPPGTPCILNNVELRGAVIYDPMAITPETNTGIYNFAHSSPLDYRNVGSLVGLDQPVLETKAPPP